MVGLQKTLEEDRLVLKTNGIVRRMDELGRVVIPMALRRKMGIGEKELLEIFVVGDDIVLNKFQPSCVFCSNTEDVRNYKGKMVCKLCLTEISRRVG